jgi:uroporphyrinogen III methyltransferase / synthase
VTGTVYLVGAGPGDPGLLTVRGRAVLDACDAVVYDALVNPLILPSGPAMHFVGKRGGDEGSAKQADINALLVQLALDGKTVVRLKGGDPFVFGRGSEEAQALAAAGVPFEVVPGVTAGVAAAAYAGIPVTHRGVATAVTFVTGHEDPSKPDTQTDWAALARAGGTIVLYMGVKRVQVIAAALMAGGMSAATPAAAIQWGTMGSQRTVVATVATIADETEVAGLGAPVIFVIGAAVKLREEIAWFERRPLFGRRVLVTRAATQAGSLSDRLRAMGADVLELPATRIEVLDTRPLAEAIGRIGEYQELVLTSQNGVRVFWETLRGCGLDARALSGLRVSAVGTATAESLLAIGVVADVVPENFSGSALMDAIGENVRGRRVLYPAAEGAKVALAEGLRARGAVVDMLPVYRSALEGATGDLMDSIRRSLADGEVDLVTFTSGYTVTGFIDAVGAELAVRAPAAVIGPLTGAAARAKGFDVVIESKVATIPEMVDAIVAHVGR